jgi:subtilisin family serine protease
MADVWHFEDLGIELLQQDSKGEGIRVAVLDTGVAALDGAWSSLRALGPGGVEEDPVDMDGHGTSCASLIASLDSTAPGIAPDVELVSIKVTASNAPVERLVRAAFDTAVDADCHVISCSFTLKNPSESTLDAVRRASARGIVVVAASGNDPNVASAFPERTPNVLVVGPYDAERQPLQARSGLFTDILAPGEDLPVLGPDGGSGVFGQSSGAAAVVAGVVALVLSVTRGRGVRRMGLAIEGLARATALRSDGASLFNPAGLLEAARRLP